MKPAGWMLWVALGGLWFCACAGPDDGDVDLTPYAGRFDVTEDWRLDEVDVQCPPPPTDIVYNRVTIKIKRNIFEANFDDRWGEMPGGEIHEDTRFLTARGQPDDRVEFSGDYADEDNFSAIMKDIRQGCTRLFDVVGVRVVP